MGTSSIPTHLECHSSADWGFNLEDLHFWTSSCKRPIMAILHMSQLGCIKNPDQLLTLTEFCGQDSSPRVMVNLYVSRGFITAPVVDWFLFENQAYLCQSFASLLILLITGSCFHSIETQIPSNFNKILCPNSYDILNLMSRKISMWKKKTFLRFWLHVTLCALTA